MSQDCSCPRNPSGWKATMRNLIAGNWIAIVALIVASPPFISFVQRAATQPTIDVFAPTDVDFRTADLIMRRTDDGTRQFHRDGTTPAVDESTEKQTTYVIIPVSYINRGDAGEDFVVLYERLQITIGKSTIYFRSAYTTMIAPRELPSWIGNTESRLASTLSGGMLRSDEVVFVPVDQEHEWGAFVALLTTHRSEQITIVLEVATGSRGIFRSAPCHVTVERLLVPLDDAESDHPRDYYATSQCDSTGPG